MAKPLIIGISSRIHHPVGPVRDLGGVYAKTLHYLEQSVAHWVIAKDVLAVMIPAIESEGLIQRSDMSLASYAEYLDGLVLQGGADIAPQSYGETPLHPDWAGDAVRDRLLDVLQRLAGEQLPVRVRVHEAGGDADLQAGLRIHRQLTSPLRTGAGNPRPSPAAGWSGGRCRPRRSPRGAAAARA
jgi:hypothetical protein